MCTSYLYERNQDPQSLSLSLTNVYGMLKVRKQCRCTTTWKKTKTTKHWHRCHMEWESPLRSQVAGPWTLRPVVPEAERADSAATLSPSIHLFILSSYRPNGLLSPTVEAVQDQLTGPTELDISRRTSGCGFHNFHKHYGKRGGRGWVAVHLVEHTLQRGRGGREKKICPLML